MFTALSVALSLAVSPLPSNGNAPALPAACSVEAMHAILEDAAGWKDVGPGAVEDPELAAYFEQLMPDYSLAYLHRDSLGVLLIGGRTLSDSRTEEDVATDPDIRWRRVADATREACEAASVSCDVSLLRSLPMGVSADSVLEDGDAGETLQRVTVAFDGPGQCAYSVQFTSPAEAFSESAWRRMRDELISLRQIVVSEWNDNRNHGF